MKQVGEVAVQPRAERSAFGRWRTLAGLVGVLALACGLWWWSHPTVLSSRAQGSTVEAAPRPVAQAELHVGVSLRARICRSPRLPFLEGRRVHLLRSNGRTSPRTAPCWPLTITRGDRRLVDARTTRPCQGTTTVRLSSVSDSTSALVRRTT